MRRKTNAIWTTEKEELVKLTLESPSLGVLLRKLGFKVFNGGHYKSLKKRLNQDKINFSHIPLGIDSNRGRISRELSKEEVLAKWFVKVDFTYGNRHVVKFVKKFRLLEYRCEKCQNNGEWQNEKLSLQLDHKNGCREDNRLENLRWLCPNCHSQTSNFSGKKKSLGS